MKNITYTAFAQFNRDGIERTFRGETAFGVKCDAIRWLHEKAGEGASRVIVYASNGNAWKVWRSPMPLPAMPSFATGR